MTPCGGVKIIRGPFNGPVLRAVCSAASVLHVAKSLRLLRRQPVLGRPPPSARVTNPQGEKVRRMPARPPSNFALSRLVAWHVGFALVAMLLPARTCPAQQAGRADQPEEGAESRIVVTAEQEVDVPDITPENPGAEPLPTPGDPAWQECEPGWVGPDAADDESLWQRWFGGPSRWTSNGRARGFGNPLGTDSWLMRPYSLGFFSGGLRPSDPIRGSVNGTPGYLVGFRLGWDVENFWGVESRFGFSTYGLRDAQLGQPMGKLAAFFFDLDLLYYPWGDTQWRPFILLGGGLADYKFANNRGQLVHETPFDIPFGVGLKYRHNSQWAFRVDVTDNLTFASGENVSQMNNISVTGSIEARFGIGPRKSYWPWNPTRSYRY